MNQAVFPDLHTVWALVGYTVLLSVVLHGVTATPVMGKLERLRR